MNKLVIIGLLLSVTNLNAGIFAKKKSGRTCIVCKEQMAWTDGHLLTFQNYLDEDGKHKVVIVKTDNSTTNQMGFQDQWFLGNQKQEW